MSDELVIPSNVTRVAPLRALAPPELITRRHGMFPDTSEFSGLVTESFLSGESPRLYDSWFDIVVDILEELLSAGGLDIKGVVEKVVVDRGELTIFIVCEHIVQVTKYLRDGNDLRFEMCLDTNGTHYPLDEGHELHAIYPL